MHSILKGSRHSIASESLHGFISCILMQKRAWSAVLCKC